MEKNEQILKEGSVRKMVMNLCANNRNHAGNGVI